MRRQTGGEIHGPWSWTDLLRFDQAVDHVVRAVQSADPGMSVGSLMKRVEESAGPFRSAGFQFSPLLDVRLRRVLSRMSPSDVYQLLRRLSSLASESGHSSVEGSSSDLSLWESSLKRGLLVRIHADLAVAMQPWCRGVFPTESLASAEEVARAWTGMISTAGAYVALLHEAGLVMAEIETRRRVAHGLVALALGRIADSERARLFSRLPSDALQAIQTASVPPAFHSALATQPGEITRAERQVRQIGGEIADELLRRQQHQLHRITDLLAEFASEPNASTAAASQLLANLQELRQLLETVSESGRPTVMPRAATVLAAAAGRWSQRQAEHPDFLDELSCRDLRRLQDDLRALQITALDGEVAGVLTERFHQSQVALLSTLGTFLEALAAADSAAAMIAAHDLAEQLASFEDLASPAALAPEAEIISRGMSARDVLRRTLIGLNRPVEQLQWLARQLESPAMQLARDVLQYGAASTRAQSPQQSDAFYRSWLIFSELADAFDDVLVTQAADMIPMLERPERRRKFTNFPSEFLGVLRDVFGVTISPEGK